ncbi:hypothetical protein MPH_09021 [Macrophomina phaseolina MS6]|uniref:SnoaL-like domain-containing protein n=2 Tax=Macrophomina phaseolina TaxID=35725 RepID=K2RUG0_MACPH|nr:hypothetical protein MPH_09021 [Macrophomina phaseolina MS6]KAH7052353.1 hypothetical protein B0J12DRAFT_71016 [Macrophomina phaseolina]
MLHLAGLHWTVAFALAAVAPVGATRHPNASGSCAQIGQSPLTVQQVAAYFHPREVIDVQAVETIRRTQALYPLAIDGKAWDLLGDIFAEDAVANYSAPLGLLQGVSGIISGLQSGLAMFSGTQHLLGSQIIDVCSPDSAISLTYYTASHFLNATAGSSAVTDDGQALYAYGQYQDMWKKQEDRTWKIVHRNLVYMGPLISDVS